MCDTFLALPAVTADGSVVFGKNSDREPNEAQALEYHPAQEFEPASTVQCTYLAIPQVRETYATLLCRPFWMWGAEMGANEKGVVIGNEAVWTRMPLNKKSGLTGMDILRLALERSATAGRALEIMVQLLADFGQGGITSLSSSRCGWDISRLVRQQWGSHQPGSPDHSPNDTMRTTGEHQLLHPVRKTNPSAQDTFRTGAVPTCNWPPP